jgi:hypothetical protein
MFTPGTNRQDRYESCSMGLTGLLTEAVILLMVAGMVPKASSANFPLLGMQILQNTV